MNRFCTISTYSHLYKVYALAESLQKQGHQFLLDVLVTDSKAKIDFVNCKFWSLNEISTTDTSKKIIAKYNQHADKLRWSLKPVFISHLLNTAAKSVIYLDNDLYFFSGYQFLFDLLQQHSFLLTPHYYKHNTLNQQNWLEANFRVGLYNAGFVGANTAALPTLQWWADCCLYRCEKNFWRGLFDDQKYLDLVPVIDENAYVIRHKGCNVASWNSETNRRSLINNEIAINQIFPLVFVHFNAFTIREIVEGRDAVLQPCFAQYEKALTAHKPSLTRSELYQPQPLTEKIKLAIWKLLTALGN